MRVRITKQDLEKPQKPLFFLVLQAENTTDKEDLEKIVFGSKNGFNYNPGVQLKDSEDRVLSLTIPISRPQMP